MIKQADIAKRLGISLSAVSRALSPVKGKSDTVSEETRRHIRATAAEMGYRNDPYASSLRKGFRPTIGAFLPPWKGHALSELIMGLSSGANECGLPLNFFFDMTQNSYGRFIDSMKGQRNSGIISYVPKFDDYTPDPSIMRGMESYMERGGKIVFLNTLKFSFPGIPSVNVDECHGGRLAAEHLIAKGCRRCHIIRYGMSIYTERAAGCMEALKRHGVQTELITLDGPPVERAAMDDAATRILESRAEGASGVFATDDIFARYILHHAIKRNVRLGEELHIVSYGWRTSEPSPCEYVKVTQPFFEIGLRAIRKLDDLTKGGTATNELLRPCLLLPEME